MGDTGAAFGQNAAEFNVFRTDRQLAGLQTMTRMLGRINEKKALVYFGSGYRVPIETYSRSWNGSGKPEPGSVA